jgi:hypothetical protein
MNYLTILDRPKAKLLLKSLDIKSQLPRVGKELVIVLPFAPSYYRVINNGEGFLVYIQFKD